MQINSDVCMNVFISLKENSETIKIYLMKFTKSFYEDLKTVHFRLKQVSWVQLWIASEESLCDLVRHFYVVFG